MRSVGANARGGQRDGEGAVWCRAAVRCGRREDHVNWDYSWGQMALGVYEHWQASNCRLQGRRARGTRRVPLRARVRAVGTAAGRMGRDGQGPPWPRDY